MGTLLTVALMGLLATSVAQDDPAAILDKAAAAGRAGNFKQALTILDGSLPAFEKTGDPMTIGRGLFALGWAQWGTGQYDAAYATYERALGLFRQIGEARAEAFTLMRMGETLYSKGQYVEALARYEQSLTANVRAKDRMIEALTYSNQGSALRSLGRYDEAVQALELATRIFRETGDDAGLAQALTFMGLVNRARSEYTQAIQAYTAAAAIRRKLGDKRGEAQTVGNLGNVYSDIGQFETALEAFTRSLALAEESGYTAQIGFSQQSIGGVLSRNGRTADALARFERALEIWRQINRRPQIGWTLREIGLLRLYDARDYAGARRAFEEALAVSRETRDPEMEGYLTLDLGDVDSKSGSPERALPAFQEALALARKIGSPKLEHEVLADRGRVLLRLGRHDEGIADLRASVAIVNDLRSRVTSDSSKVAFLDTRQAVFQDLAAALLAAGRAAEALEIAESSRARALADLLESRQVKPRVTEARALADLRTAAQGPVRATASSGDPAGGRSEVADAIARLRVHDAELASLVNVESPRLDEIRGTAARLRATVIEYLVTDEGLLVWLVTPSGDVHSARSAASSAHVTAIARAALEALDVSDAAMAKSRGPQRELRALYDLAVAPVSRWLPAEGELIVIVPHGPLALVPFAALPDSSGTPLVARYRLASAPSVSVFRYTGSKRRSLSAQGDALILTSPVTPRDANLPALPGTRDEGRRVAARLTFLRPSVLEGAQASEHALKQRIGGADVVHFATHGLVSEVRPADSSLVLAEGDGEDGYLRVSEVFGLDIDAALVVLSGCSTGRGRLTGDGIFGLSRAFLYAGTPSIVVSLWDVSDQATAYLMDRFYANFTRTGDRAGALRAAQLATRQRYPHPAFWAPFVLVGESR